MQKSCQWSVLILGFGSLAVAQEAAKPPITLEELRKRQVVGTLGKPLGTVVEVEANVIAGSELLLKEYDGRYLLKITHVNGQKLDEPTILRFDTGFSDVELANDHFSLYELKHGKKTGRLSSEQVTELEKGYVGKSVRLAVYEEGTFRGIPKNMPSDARIWSDVTFHFGTSIVILADRAKTTEKSRKGK